MSCAIVEFTDVAQISHDQYFLKSLNCSLWLASRRKKNIYPYPNTLEEYAERQASMIKRKKEKQN